LSDKDILTIVAWVTAGAPKGRPKDMPAPLNLSSWAFETGPSLAYREFAVPESGMVEYQYVIVPTGFTEDKWVQAAGAAYRAFVVHHIIMCVSLAPTTSGSKARRIFEACPRNRRES
jgi:hypothetical protein